MRIATAKNLPDQWDRGYMARTFQRIDDQVNRLSSNGLVFSYRSISGTRTLDDSDEFVNCSSGTFTVTLPTAVGFIKQYIIKNSGSGVITIATTSSQTIDGNLTIGLNQYDSVTVRSTNANWAIV